ncbi:hypothetical protein CLM62_16840 [Streptomyces sp. SA15]|uniref:hypothetical protein n=1 Tax=Streptomyces sp. SA15 TaxID=934019 RepID=UPI000BB0BAD7|nr:hypothetical protein [Streptomyces sp. SA15]PAZ14884.1 hypothetical protein CLM62_16840 [Streptomyces sp. SA15]
MASRASSDVPASEAPVQIPKLPGLGTSWYERGARYWARRVRTAILVLLLLAFFCYIALRLYVGVPRSDLPPTARTVWDWTQAVASGVAVAWGWVKQRRDHRKKLLDPPTPQQMWEAKRGDSTRAPGLARAAVLPLLIAAPVLPAIAAWGVGWFAAMLTVHEYPSEVGARRWLEERTSRGA